MKVLKTIYACSENHLWVITFRNLYSICIMKAMILDLCFALIAWHEPLPVVLSRQWNCYGIRRAISVHNTSGRLIGHPIVADLKSQLDEVWRVMVKRLDLDQMQRSHVWRWKFDWWSVGLKTKGQNRSVCNCTIWKPHVEWIVLWYIDWANMNGISILEGNYVCEVSSVSGKKFQTRAAPVTNYVEDWDGRTHHD